MRDQTCDHCPDGQKLSALFMLQTIGQGDVKLLCPGCLVAYGEALRTQLEAVTGPSDRDVETPSTTPVPDPTSDDETDDDTALDGALTDTGTATDPQSTDGAVPQTDATPPINPPAAVPAEPSGLGSV